MIMKCANCYDSVASMLADKLKVIETMSDEIQTLRAKVASAEVLVEALKEANALNVNWSSEAEPHTLEYFSEYKAVIKIGNDALSTYDKLSEVKHDTK